MKKLWTHQEKLLELVREEARKGAKAVVCVMPTGSGKTHSAAAMVHQHFARKPDGRVLVCAHRDELVTQMYDSFEEWGLLCGVIQASPSRTVNPYRPVQIASTQTLLARKLVPEASMVIYDECFPAGTLIDGRTPIENIRPGDLVDSVDHETGLIELRPVVRLFKRKPSALCRINGVVCTPNHKFFVPGEGYVQARDLQGKWIVRRDFELVRVNSVELLEPGDGHVYNFEVERNHNYFAGGYLVSNCHHYMSDKWSEIALEYKNRGVFTIGLTATPIRADDRGFGEVFDSIVVPITTKEAIARGILVPYTLRAPDRELRSGQIAQRPVDAYREHALGRKTILFATSVKEAERFRDQFREAGFTSECIHGGLGGGERTRILTAYKYGTIQVLTSVGVLTEGFDDRATSCVIIARSIGSIAFYLQAVGRALRTSPETGKKDAILIDLFGSCRKLGAPDDDREWCLDGEIITGKGKLETSDVRLCPVCKVTLEGDVYYSECPECGTVLGPKEQEVINVPLVKYAAKRRETPEKRRAYFNKLVADARSKGWSVPWQPVRKYTAIYGEKPPKEWYGHLISVAQSSPQE